MIAVLVDKGKNSPSNANSSDGEVMLDIEVAASVAPGANVAVYFTPNTDQGFIDAISTAVHDKTNKPNVISISWGGPESTWTAQAMTALDSACQAAAALGVTITVAAGDNGSSDGVTDGANHVDFPASSPHVLACGGTKMMGSGSTITSEVVWNENASNEGATGGGVSNVFPLPSWQSGSKVPKPTVAAGGRGVPDVAGDADPETGYTVRVDGQTSTIGGTSAVAPLWAGLITLANAQNKTSAGFINPALYSAKGAKAFRDITQGNNGSFTAGPGWDACTGQGSPIGTAVIAAVAPATASKKGKKKTIAKKICSKEEKIGGASAVETNPYAKHLGERDARTVIAATPKLLHEAVCAMSPEQIENPIAPGKWSPRQIVAHLADCEIVFSFRLRQTLAETNPVIQPFDQDAWATRYDGYDMPAAMEMFRAARSWNLRLVGSLSDADFERAMTHPERGTMTFQGVLETMAGHDLNHLLPLQKLVGSE
jgi:hypothetical protein